MQFAIISINKISHFLCLESFESETQTRIYYCRQEFGRGSAGIVHVCVCCACVCVSVVCVVCVVCVVWCVLCAVLCCDICL